MNNTYYPDYWVDYSFLNDDKDMLYLERELLEVDHMPGSVCWLPCDSENNLADRFGRPGYEGSLPFLIDSEQADILLGGGPVNLAEEELLLGILAGLPEMVHMRGIPIVFEQEQILKTWLDRLEVGFGWLNRDEMITDAVCFTLARFGRPQAAAILKNHLVSRGFRISHFLAWAAIAWNEALLNRRTEPLQDLLDTISRYAVEIRESGRDGWISLVHLALLRVFGQGDSAEEAGFNGKLMKRITAPHHRMLADWVQAQAILAPEDLGKLGTAPLEYLEDYKSNLPCPGAKLPEYRRTRLQFPRNPIPNVLAYQYHAGTTSSCNAYGVDESDLGEVIEELLNQTEKYYRWRPGGPFLIGLTLQEILKGNPKAGGILMALADEELHRRIDPRMEELHRKYMGTA